MKMKRIVAFFLAALMTMSCMSLSTLTAGATEVATKATIKVETVTAAAGSQVEVPVSITDNPGILGMTLHVEYDDKKVALVNVENGDTLNHMVFTTPKDLSNGCTLPWDAEFVSEEDIKNGVIVTLTFEVFENVEVGESIPVSLKYTPGAIIDNDLNSLTVNIENGAINVMNFTPGDLNEDGIINTADIVYLRRYIAGGYGVEINENAGDVNADGSLNTTDVVCIRRFVAGGYNIELKPGKHIHTEVTDAAREATCTETGLTEGKHCAKCGEVLLKQETVPAKGHDFVDGVCTVCGHKQLDYGGETVRILYWKDVERTEFDVPELTGDKIGDALYRRNATVEDQLNVNFEWVGTNGNYNNQANFVAEIQSNANAGGDKLYDVFAGYSMTSATIAVNGLAYDLAELSTIHFDQPWWPASLKSENSIDDRLYYCTGDLSTNMLNMMYCTYFNQDLAAELNVGNLYEMVDAGTWTLDKMAELSSNAYADLNGDGTRDTGDRYGIAVGSNIHFDAFFTGSNLRTIEKDAEDIPYVSDSFSSKKTVTLLEKLVNIFHAREYSAFAATISGWSNRPFAEGHVLFIVDRAYVLTSAAFNNSNIKVGMLPMPKYDVSQDSYVTAMAFPFTTYSVSGALDKDRAAMAGSVLETLSEESFRVVSPAWYETNFDQSHQNGGENARMFDLVRKNIRIEFGRIFTTPLKNITYSPFRSAVNNGNTNWTTIIKAETRVLARALDRIVDSVLENNLSHSHTVSGWTITKPATCTETGIRSGVCIDCGKTETETVARVAHTYVNGVCSVCGAQEILPGTIIYEETFDYFDDSNTESVLNTIGWTKLTKEADGVYNETDGEFAIIDGRLYYDNWDRDGLPEGDTRIRGKDGYYAIDMLNNEYMKPFAAEKYTLQYDLEYTDSKSISRYAVIITECSADGQCYNSFHFRIGGYANNQAHFYGSWKTYDAFDPATDLNGASQAKDAEEASIKGTPIGFKLLGKYYNADDVHMFANIPVTIRLQWDPEMGHHVYMKTADMAEFVKVSEPSVNADGPMYVGSWDGYAVQFKFGATIEGYIDNIMMWTGWGEKPAGHVVNAWTVIKDASCTESGMKQGVCESCQKTVKQVIPQLAHNYDNNICTLCGEEKFSEGLSYTLSSDGTHYIVSGIGRCTDTALVIPCSYNGLEVKEIGNRAFYSNATITSVKILEGVEIISEEAFRKCSELTSITIPNSVTDVGIGAFRECVGLTSVIIPDSVTCIDNGAFRDCTGMTSVVIGCGVTRIGNNSFRHCTGLTSVIIPDNVTSTGTDVFRDCVGLTSVVLSNNLTTISNNMFRDCTALTSVTIPDGVTNVGNYVFGGCTALASVTLGNGLTNIGKDMFKACVNLTTIDIPDSVTNIGDYAFLRCSGLTSVTIPDSVESIGYCSFDSCTALTSVDLGDGVTNIGIAAFLACSSLTSVTIPDGVTSISDSAFGSCSSLTSVTIPNSVTSIGASAFARCTALTSVTIPDSVKRIADLAFYKCTALTSVNVPDSVTSIGDYAFDGCPNLTTINIPTSLTSLGEYALPRSLKGTTTYENGLYLGSQDNPYLILMDIVDHSVRNFVVHKDTKIIYTGAVSNALNLTSVTLPEELLEIGASAFSGCKMLSSIEFPDTLRTINSNAFSRCSSLTALDIPASVIFIGSGITVGCSSMTSLMVASDNPIYYSKNNCIIKTKTKELVATCKTSVIPDDGSIAIVGQQAFQQRNELTSFTIPYGVTTIEWQAFGYCTGLTSVFVPNSVTSIEVRAFYKCANLTAITYDGTIAQWNAITKETNWNLDTGAYTIYCTDGTLAK